MERFQTWGDALFNSTAGALQNLMGFLPRLIGFALILIAGWFVAWLIAEGVSRLLRGVRFNELAERSGFGSFVRNMGVRTDASDFVGLITKWFVRLIALVVAFDALGLPAVSDILRQVLLFLPNVVVALVALVLGGLAANALAGLVRGTAAQAGVANPDLLATIARWAVWAFAIVVAINQLGIATTLINTLFMAVVGAIALALGLAFGLGGRETAGQILRNWYERGRLSTADGDAMQRSTERLGLGDGPPSTRTH